MKFLFDFINDYAEVADFKSRPDDLARLLTEAGLETEVSRPQSKPLYSEKIIVAEIRSVKKHPNAERLSICEADTGGESRLLPIVCGASNMKEGDKAVLALPGAELPGGTVIKTSRIRGIESRGMFLSASELGFSSNPPKNPGGAPSKGIVILPPETKAGSLFSKIASGPEKETDLFLEVSVTPNRADCLSFKGLGREIACLLRRPLKKPPRYESATKPRSSWKPFMKKELSLKIQNPSDCPRYCGRMIRGVSVAPSPDWLARRLIKTGMKPVNNVVDATNFILMDLGQPLHAFDRDKIGSSLQVSRSLKGESFRALDGALLELTGEELSIRTSGGGAAAEADLAKAGRAEKQTAEAGRAEKQTAEAGRPAADRCPPDRISADRISADRLSADGKAKTLKSRPIALAGVIGGADSAVSNETKNIFLEGAVFAPETVRRTAKQFGLQTESSYRFARGIDESACRAALDKAAALIQELAGGSVSGDFFDERREEPAPLIEIRLQDIEERLGFAVSAETFVNCMKRIGCRLENPEDATGKSGGRDSKKSPAARPAAASKNLFFVRPPAFRKDLKIKEDLTEETARLSGYDKAPVSEPKKNPGPPSAFAASYVLTRKTARLMEEAGFCRALNYSFGEKAYYEEFLLKNQDSLSLMGLASPKRSFVSLQNPLNLQSAVMKPLLLPDLLRNVVYNLRYGNKQGRLFELASVFFKIPEEIGGAASGPDANPGAGGPGEQTSGKPGAKTRRGPQQKSQGEGIYRETEHISFVCWGNPETLWRNKNSPPAFYFLKSAAARLLKKLQPKGFVWDFKPPELSFIHPGQMIGLKIQGAGAGFIGSVHPSWKARYKTAAGIDLAAGEICLGKFPFRAGRPEPFKITPPKEFPALERDLTFILPQELPAAEVAREIKKAAGADSAEIIAVYEDAVRKEKAAEKGAAEETKRAVSFRFYLTAQKRAWTDEELLQIQNRAIEAVGKKFSVSLKT